jgi:hypothetical protein
MRANTVGLFVIIGLDFAWLQGERRLKTRQWRDKSITDVGDNQYVTRWLTICHGDLVTERRLIGWPNDS